MANWLPREERLSKLGTASGGNIEAHGALHSWAFVDGAWRCGDCGTWTKHDSTGPLARTQVCKGWAEKWKVKHANSRGHRLRGAEREHGLVFCTRCGAFSTRRARKLLKHCVASTKAGKQALKRIEKDGYRGIVKSRASYRAVFFPNLPKCTLNTF